jgi:hypothetical protein
MKIFIVCLTNAILVALITWRVLKIDDDKALLIFLFYYPLLMVINFIIGGVLKLMKREGYKIYWIVCACAAVLFVPILVFLLIQIGHY